MQKTILITLLVAIYFTSTVFSDDVKYQGIEESDIADIEKIHENWTKAFQTGNKELFSSIFTSNAFVLNALREKITGKDAIEQIFLEDYKIIGPAETEIKIQILKNAGLGSIYCKSQYIYTFYINSEKKKTLGKFEGYLNKEEGTWKFSSMNIFYDLKSKIEWNQEHPLTEEF
ncbi:MAG: nuclear transport factor 2 family protein [Acidobacteria bacterium]|nr:nuclear transport factor 2 family protein [Acidobacteriota bacterium]